MKKISAGRFFILAAFVLALTGGVNAAVLTVTKAADSRDGVCDSDCSLREAVTETKSGDSINFLPALKGATLTLGGEEIVVDKNISVEGLGARSLTISGSLTSRIFLIKTGGALKLTNMTLTGGNGVSNTYATGVGGAICAQPQASLTLDRVNVHDNHVSYFAGAVELQEGVHRITNSSLTNNSASTGTALSVESFGNLFLSNVTISGNYDSDGGEGVGAIFSAHAETRIRNSTIVNNTASLGGGIRMSGGMVEIGNSIIAGNTAATGANLFTQYNRFDSVGGNLIGEVDEFSGSAFYRVGDVKFAVPLLAPLGFYGGDIRVHALGVGSLARDTGLNARAIDPFDNSFLMYDARGAGFVRIVNNTVDKGAFESLANAGVSGRVLTAGGRGVANATVTLSSQAGEIRTARTNSLGYYRFKDVPVGQVYTLIVSAKGKSFAPQNLDVVDQMDDFNFTAEN